MQIHIDTHHDRMLLPAVAALLMVACAENRSMHETATENSDPAQPAEPQTETTTTSTAAETPAPTASTASSDEVAVQRRKRRSKAEIEAEAVAQAQPAAVAETVAEPVAEAAAVVETAQPEPEVRIPVDYTPPATPTRSVEDVRAKLGDLLASKGMPACQKVLASFNATAVKDLKPAQYDAAYNAIELEALS